MSVQLITQSSPKLKNFGVCLTFRLKLPIALILASSVLTTACLREQEDRPTSSRAGYAGCLEATATGKDSATVKVEMLDLASEVQIYRNGTWVGSVFPGNTDSDIFVDNGIPAQGEVYRYSCRAMVKSESKIGYNEPTIQTIPEDAPEFNGLSSVTIQSNVNAYLQWKAPTSTGPRVKTYKIYANLDKAISPAASYIDLEKEPMATIAAPATSYTLSGVLGDKLPYVFSVAACTFNDVCTGTSVIKTESTLENGAPTSTGITSITTQAGGIKINVPWTDGMGEITKRTVYMGTTNTTSLSSYQSIRAFPVALDDLKQTSTLAALTTLDVIDSRILENTQYYFMVIDQDSAGNKSSPIVYPLHTYDLTPPTFAGISAVAVNPTTPSSAVDITFLTAKTQGSPDNDATGASTYKVLYTSTPYVDGSTTWPGDPCKTGTVYSTEYTANPGGVAGGTSASITVTGLTPRTFYRFCLKAVDAAGNESADQDASALIPIATHDTVAPLFDGIQGLTGISESGVYKLKVSWNKATDVSSTIKQYQVKAWSNNPSSTAATDLTTIVRLAAGSLYDTGTNIINGTDFNYGQGVTVYIVVNACDTAADIPGGSMNCTDFPDNTAMTIVPPDIVAPIGFDGVTGATSTTNGTVVVSWDTPTPSWTSDYYGFRVYNSVLSGSDYVLTLLKSCPCATPGSCTSPTDLSCSVPNLDANRTYRFHVRAVDAAGNETQLDPKFSYENKVVADTVAPTFAPAPSLSWSTADAAIKVTWTAATDNQYTGDLRYEIYRKYGTDFTSGEIANPTSPRTTVTNVVTYIDTDDYVTPGGGTYYYLLCAKDAQNNRKCDTMSKSIDLPDTQPPVFQTSIESTKSTDTSNLLRVWNLKFKVTDNSTRLDRLDVKVYSTYTSAAETPAEISGNLDSNANLEANRTDDSGTNYITLSNIYPKTNDYGYVNYLVVVSDLTGNKATKSVSFTYDTRLTIASIASNQANKDIAKTVLIQGTGFSKGTENGAGTNTEIKIGTSTCINVTIYSSAVMTCETASGVGAGVTSVTLTNPEGTSATLSNGFTFTDGATYPHDYCDTTAGQTGTPFASGAGTSTVSPYLICTLAQFQQIPNYLGSYFKLGAHLDLSALSTLAYRGYLDGSGFMLYNFTSATGAIFNHTAAANGVVSVKNLVLFNNSVSVGNSAMGILFNEIKTYNSSGYTGNVEIDNLSFISNTITNSFGSGNTGLIAGKITGLSLSISNISISGNTLNTTGYTGFLAGTIQSVNGSNSYPTTHGLIKNISIDDSTLNCTGTSGGGCGSIAYSVTSVSLENLTISATLDGTQFYKSGLTNIFTTSSALLASTEVVKNINLTLTVPSATLTSTFKSIVGVHGAPEVVFTDITLNYDITASSYASFAQTMTMNTPFTIKNLTVTGAKIAGSEAILSTFGNITSKSYSSSDVFMIENVKIRAAGPIIKPTLFIELSGFINGITLSDNGAGTMGKFTLSKISIVDTSSSNGTTGLSSLLGSLTYSGTTPAPSTPVLEVSDVLFNAKVNNGWVGDWSSTAGVYAKFSRTLFAGATTYGITDDTGATEHASLCTGASTGSAGNFIDNATGFTKYTGDASGTSCDGFSGQDTADLQNSGSGNVFETAGWDFTNVWKWPSGTGYPELR